MGNDSEIADALARQLRRFETVVQALDAAGALAAAQTAFDEINRSLELMSKAERVRAIDVLARVTGRTLRQHEVDEEIVRDSEERIKNKWLALLEARQTVSLRKILGETTISWKRAVEDARKVKKRRRRRQLTSSGIRLVVGGGALVFDSAKFMLVSPIPTFMFSSFIGGVTLLVDSIERVLED